MKHKLLLVLIILPVLLAACAGRSPDVLALTQEYVRKIDAHDIEGVMAMFAADAQFEMVGQGTLPNLDAIRALHEYGKGIQNTLTLQNCAADKLTVTCELVENNDWLDAAGLDEIFYPSAVFTFNEAGLIQNISATLSSEDSAAMGGVLAEFIPWLMAERPEESAPLFGPDGQFIYSEVNGRLVVQLLKEWQGAKGG